MTRSDKRWFAFTVVVLALWCGALDYAFDHHWIMVDPTYAENN